MGTFKFDALQLVLMALPLIILWWQGRFRLGIELQSLPDTAEFKPYFILFVLITVHVVIVWLGVLT